MSKTKEKKSSLKSFNIRVRLLPGYWKVIISILLAVFGWTAGTTLFFAGSDISMVSGIVVLALLFWLLINMWLPAKKETKEEPEDNTEE